MTSYHFTAIMLQLIGKNILMCHIENVFFFAYENSEGPGYNCGCEHSD